MQLGRCVGFNLQRRLGLRGIVDLYRLGARPTAYAGTYNSSRTT